MMRGGSSMSGRAGRTSWVLGLVLGIRGVNAGYLGLNMTSPSQCGNSTVQWWGDDGPYHLLLTPTQHVEHSYNVWLPSIDNGTNTYNLSINQPEGSQFLVTMWGASGISYAATTDVMTVGPPMGKVGDSCFLSDSSILDLYSFAFNISDDSGGFPPQCSNLTFSWPTSLRTNVTGGKSTSNITNKDTSNSSLAATKAATTDIVLSEIGYKREDDDDIRRRAGSALSSRRSNPSDPPTIFGVIPLGNSFSLPITYPYDSPIADNLPNTSLSDDPTTYMAQGKTFMNWTVSMAKGTRFILVAGIGSEMEWASGGSSQLLTVGQGGTSCRNSGSTHVPQVTATSEPSSNPSSSDSDPAQSSSDRSMSTAVIVVAVVISVLGTLTIVGFLLFCWQYRRRRALQRQATGCASPSSDTSRPLKALSRGNAQEYSMTDRSTHPSVDMASNAGPSGTSTYIASGNEASQGYRDSEFWARSQSPPSPSSPSHHQYPPSPTDRQRPNLALDSNFTPIRGSVSSGGTGNYSSPISPAYSSSAVPLLRDSKTPGSPSSPAPFSPHPSALGTFSSGFTSLPNAEGRQPPPLPPRRPQNSNTGPLRLHGDRDRSLDDQEEGDEDGDEVHDLKIRTLTGATEFPDESQAEASRHRGNRRRDGVEYVVHQDAGRIRNEPTRRRVELPPRYEELDWRDEEGQAEGEGQSSRADIDPVQDANRNEDNTR